MTVRKPAFAAILLASVVPPALAQNQGPVPLNGLYIGAGAGPNWMQNLHVNSGVNRGITSALDSTTGFTSVLSIGYALPSGWRFEFEGDYRRNTFNHASNIAIATNTTGTQQKYGFMFNVLYDVSNYISVPWVQPYVGAGIGYSWNALASVRLNGAATGFPAIATGGTQAGFAYQAIVGAAYPIVSVRGLALTAEYRFFGTNSNTYDISAVAARGSPIERGTAKLSSNYNHSLMFGLRYNFGLPPPAPPAPIVVPAPAPSRSYLVFFDWDKADLTDRARQIIADAAVNSTKVQYTKIEVNGYTDTSGTPKYNQGLSVRRAKAVQAELIKNNVPPDIINIQGFGDTKLLVPTGPGVREPQNRRVEIIIR